MCVRSLLARSLVCQQIWSAQKTGNCYPANNHPISLFLTFHSIDWIKEIKLCGSCEMRVRLLSFIFKKWLSIKNCVSGEEKKGELTDQLPRFEDQKVSNFDPANFPYKSPPSSVVKMEFIKNLSIYLIIILQLHSTFDPNLWNKSSMNYLRIWTRTM